MALCQAVSPKKIEGFFSDLEGDAKIKACEEYGVIYYYRKGEKDN